jgi:hypothetical protein
MMVRVAARKSANPLDALMTKAQVVRRKFKSSLPRAFDQRLSKLEAIAKTIELYERFRREMETARLDKSDVSAALVYCQPQTPGKEHVLAEVVKLPDPERGNLRMFVETTMALDMPFFLGVLFLQNDREAEKAEHQNVLFAWPFTKEHDAHARLLAAKNQQAKGGFKKVAN